MKRYFSSFGRRLEAVATRFCDEMARFAQRVLFRALSVLECAVAALLVKWLYELFQNYRL